MAVTEHQAITVREMSQAGQARRTAATLARRLGFDIEDSGRVGLVVTEAATNLVKHAQGGEIVVGAASDVAGAVDILALDRGPGIRDLDRALRDGYSTSGSMGSGLGAIRRVASDFDLYTSDAGTILFARVEGGGGAASARAGSAAAGLAAVELGGINVPYPGETVCGDAWTATHRDGRIRILVADGLGHGPDAHQASSVAVRVFSEHPEDAPAEAIARLHDALRPTRGAAASVVELSAADRMARICGIGNISGLILSDEGSRSMVSHHGVLGHTAPRIGEFVYPWPARSLLVLHSDGIGTHWDLARYPGLSRRHPTLIAAVIYRDFHRRRDDATVVAVREAS